MSDNRAIVVVGVSRSGTSLVASLCGALGAQLCDHLIGPHPVHNPKGHFECRQFHNLTRGFIDEEIDRGGLIRVCRQLVEEHDTAPLWVVKDPKFHAVWQYLAPCFPENTRLVAVHRAFSAVARSWVTHRGVDFDVAETAVSAEFQMLHACLRTYRHPVYHIQYEDLLADPRGQAKLLGSYMGMNPCCSVLQHAAAVVDPELNRSAL